MFYGPQELEAFLLAMAISGETNANFLYASGSEFVEKYVGVGANRDTLPFEKAKTSPMCYLYR